MLLCGRHHHAIHDDAFHIVPLGHGRFRFTSADGRELPSHVDPSKLATTTGRIEDEHPRVAPDAATTRWDGTRLDRHYAVAVLAQELRPNA